MANKKKKNEEQAQEASSGAPLPLGLKSFENPFRVLYQESGMGISLANLQRLIVDVNPAFARMMGYERSELVGQTFQKLLYPEDSPLNLELHRQLLAGERDIYHMDRRYLRKNGEIVWTHLTVSLLRDQDGKPEIVMGVVEDITEQKKAEMKLAEQQAALAQAAQMSALGEMASNIAHEINNPLNVIQFRAQQIKAIGKAGRVDDTTLPKVTESSENIEKNIARIQSIVKGLQAFARKADQDPYEIITIETLLKEAHELCQDKFKYKGVELRFKPAPPGSTIECRPTQLLQVLVNLLNNAFDAIIDMKDRWVEVEVRDVKDALEIRVTDCGTGIPEEVANKMFTQFFTTKPAGKGTGLGLSISRKILEAHRGVLRLDREGSKHTCFVLGLPKRQNTSYFKAAA